MSEQKTKPTIYFVEATVKLPGATCPDGQISHGAFTFEDSVVTICHPDDPTPVRCPAGKTYTRTLQAPTNTFADAQEHARLLTIEFRTALRGGSPWWRPQRALELPSRGLVLNEAPSFYQLVQHSHRARIRKLGGPRRHLNDQIVPRHHELTAQRRHTRGARKIINARIVTPAARGCRIIP
jgi:hypothetical protein